MSGMKIENKCGEEHSGTKRWDTAKHVCGGPPQTQIAHGVWAYIVGTRETSSSGPRLVCSECAGGPLKKLKPVGYLVLGFECSSCHERIYPKKNVILNKLAEMRGGPRKGDVCPHKCPQCSETMVKWEAAPFESTRCPGCQAPAVIIDNRLATHKRPDGLDCPFYYRFIFKASPCGHTFTPKMLEDSER